MKAYAPNGSQIIGTLERLAGRAEITADSFKRAAGGTIEHEWEGGTEIFYDDQRTVQRDGEDVYLAEDGTDWKESELALLNDEESECIRHDMGGWYICTEDEAAHEDAGNNSAGFDGRQHYADMASVLAAYREGEPANA